MNPTEPAAPRGPKYVRRTIYLDARLFRHLKGLAKSETWQLADLARGLIMVGLILRHLHEAESEVVSMDHYVTAVDALNYLAHREVRRRYSGRGGGRGESVTVHLPARFLDHVDLYARGHGRSRNEALTILLQDGVLCYVFGYRHFLRAAIKARDHEGTVASQIQDLTGKESSTKPGP